MSYNTDVSVRGPSKASARPPPYLTLVGELSGGDVELLVLLLQLGELGLQLGLVQLSAVQLALCVLVVQLEVLVVPQQLLVGAVQPKRKRCSPSGSAESTTWAPVNKLWPTCRVPLSEVCTGRRWLGAFGSPAPSSPAAPSRFSPSRPAHSSFAGAACTFTHDRADKSETSFIPSEKEQKH